MLFPFILCPFLIVAYFVRKVSSVCLHVFCCLLFIVYYAGLVFISFFISIPKFEFFLEGA